MPTLMTRTFLNAFLMMALGSYAGQLAAQTVTVYKSPTCGCCTGWVDYLRDNDFEVEIFDVQDLDPIREQYGVDRHLQSCHTALVDGYVVEGHVPVNDIRRLLEEKPDIKGLSAPGMPALSPGMASLTPKNYNVLSFDEFGKVEVFSKY
jgi:hypothetical protein